MSEPPTDAEITAVLAVTNPNAQAPIIVGGTAATGWLYDTGLTYLANDLARTDRLHAGLVPAHPFMPAELAALLGDLTNSTYLMMLRSVLAHGITNTDCAFLTNSVIDYRKLCDDLKHFYDEHIAPPLA